MNNTPPVQPSQVQPAQAQNAYAPPQHTGIPESDLGSTIIPFKNGPALAGYYCAVFSLIPGIGMLLGPIAIICGIIGLRRRKKDPRVKGTAHAWVAIILGGLTTLVWYGLVIWVVVLTMTNS